MKLRTSNKSGRVARPSFPAELARARRNASDSRSFGLLLLPVERDLPTEIKVVGFDYYGFDGTWAGMVAELAKPAPKRRRKARKP